jgi:hypothetical protein
MNKIFRQLNLAEKKARWWIATDAGIKKGAKEFYDQVKKIKYLKWSESIINDQEVNNAVKSFLKQNFKRTTDQEKIEKGRIFEEYVANIYRDRGYVSIEYGKECTIRPHPDTHFKSIRTPVSESFGHAFGHYPDVFGLLTES